MPAVENMNLSSQPASQVELAECLQSVPDQLDCAFYVGRCVAVANILTDQRTEAVTVGVPHPDVGVETSPPHSVR